MPPATETPATDALQLAAGGPLIWVVGAMAAVLLILLVERTLYFRRAQIRCEAFVQGITNVLDKRRLMEARRICDETPGPVAVVVKSALLHAHEDDARLRFAVQEAAILELPKLERRLGPIGAIAQVAPLVGLLGTVLGMITTFHAFMQGGQYATAKALSAGMWQALQVTAGSLMVGIPAHLIHHYLSGRVRHMVRDIEWSGNEIMRYLLVDYRSPAPGEASGAAQEPEVGQEPSAEVGPALEPEAAGEREAEEPGS